MAGLVGIITENLDKSWETKLSLMTTSISHKSSDQLDTFVKKNSGIYLGWVAPASPKSLLKMKRDRKGEHLAVLYGETFSGDYLSDNAEDWFSHSNAEGLTTPKGRKKLLRSLNGSYSGLLLEKKASVIHVFSDRIGMRRIYYYQTDKCFAFSSEAKALLKVFPELRKLNYKALGEYLRYGTILGTETLFEGIHILPGGSVWSINKENMVEANQYFSFYEWEDQPKLTSRQFKESMKNIFPEVVNRYYKNEKEIGISLTGGLDTRIVLAAHDYKEAALPCYTYGDAKRDTFDVKIAKEVAKSLGFDHYTLPIGSQFFQDFHDLAWSTVWLSDGNQRISGTHELYLSRLAAEIAPIRLTGNYGGEVFRRTSTFDQLHDLSPYFSKEVHPYMEEARLTYDKNKSSHHLTYSLVHEIARHLFGPFIVADTQLVLRTPFLDNELLALLYAAPDTIFDDKTLFPSLISLFNPALAGIKTDRGMVLDNAGSKNLLGRMGQELTFRIEYRIGDGASDLMSRYADNRFLSGAMTLLNSQHYYRFYRSWFKKELHPQVAEILLDSRTLSREIFEKHAIQKMVKDHHDGRANHMEAISTIMSLELIFRSLLEN